jgi:hypothetical protein
MSDKKGLKPFEDTTENVVANTPLSAALAAPSRTRMASPKIE